MMKTALIALGGILLVGAPGGLIAFIAFRFWQGYRANRQGTQVPVNYQITTRQDEIVCTSEGCFRVDTGEYVPLDREAA